MPAGKDEKAVVVIELTVGGEGDMLMVDAGVAKAAVGDMEKPDPEAPFAKKDAHPPRTTKHNLDGIICEWVAMIWILG